MEVDDFYPFNGRHFNFGNVCREEVRIDKASEADQFTMDIFDFGKICVVVPEFEPWQLFYFFQCIETSSTFVFYFFTASFYLCIEVFYDESGNDDGFVKDARCTKIKYPCIREYRGIDEEVFLLFLRGGKLYERDADIEFVGRSEGEDRSKVGAEEKEEDPNTID